MRGKEVPLSFRSTKNKGEKGNLVDNDSSLREAAVASMAEIFLAGARGAADFAAFEDAAIAAGHSMMAEAMGRALEARDAELAAGRPAGLRMRDRRERTLATEVGDVSFSRCRYAGEEGAVYLLDDALDLPWGARVSPGAAAFLVTAGTMASYARTASLLARRGSSVSATAVMACLRSAGALCAEEDEAAADALYSDGVVPAAERAREALLVEADGTFLSLQRPAEGEPRRVELKAMVAYEGKERRGRKVVRVAPFHHALVGTAGELWSQGVAAMGRRWDLSRLESVHLGGDGEPWCSALGAWLPRAEVVFHLDPFHVNRAILAALPDKRLAGRLIGLVRDGGKEAAVALLKGCLSQGLARPRAGAAAVGYLEGNLGSVAVAGPSLGTMESDNQHLYGARMDSVPCGWSRAGACDMGRLISRRESGRAVPRMTRELSASPRRRRRREARELKRAGTRASEVVQSVGSGYEPPHRARVGRMAPLVSLAAGLDSGMAF